MIARFVFLAFLFPSPVYAVFAQQADDQRLIVIAVDALGADLIDTYKPPHLNALANEGVRAKWMEPVFPTVTFTNFTSLATGVGPEKHGVVYNNFYDATLGKTMENEEGAASGRWFSAEPIWLTAERQGKRSATFYWSGATEAINVVRASYVREPYDDDVSHEERVKAVLGWVDMPADNRPSFISVYFSDIDTAGHMTFPGSERHIEAIARVDETIGKLIDGLRSRGLYDKVNIIVVSDHGMLKVERKNNLVLDNYLDDTKTDRVIPGSTLTQIFPKAGEERAVVNFLSKAEHMGCYAKRKIPSGFHYRNNPRIAPVVCIADSGYIIINKQRSEEWAKKPPEPFVGIHGYDNKLPAMRATFIARGPAFKRGVIIDPIKNTDVYNIMATTLGLKSTKNDGSMKRARMVLR